MEDRHYFTRADAEILLLTHPDDRWRGTTVDCPYFRITAAGRAPIHIWNYARRDAEEMSNESQNERLDALQEGQAGGAPFDDTALSDARYELQLMLNEQRFQSTYYQFRTMSEIGNVMVKYSKQAGWEDRAEAGYTFVGGRVGSVGREVNVQGSAHPSVELTFEDMYPLGSERPLGTTLARPGFAPSHQRQGPLPERGGGDSSFVLANGTGWIDGRKVAPGFVEPPPSLQMLTRAKVGTFKSVKGRYPDAVSELDYGGPFVVTAPSEGQAQTVWIWSTENEEYRKTAGGLERVNAIRKDSPSWDSPKGETSSPLVDVIKAFEGFEGQWYEDPKGSGKYSIAFGLQSDTLDLLGVTKNGQPFTYDNFPDAVVSRREATPWLKQDVSRRATDVQELLSEKATQYEFDALVSFAYNLGVGALGGSTLLEEFNKGNTQAAGEEFLEWVKSGGERNEYLVKRRKDEKAIFLNSDYSLRHTS